MFSRTPVMREKSTQTLMSAADAPTEDALLSGSSPTMVTSGAGAGVTSCTSSLGISPRKRESVVWRVIL